MNNSKNLIIYAFLLCLTGCGSFLDEKPDKSLVIPSNLKDLQALLDDYNNMMVDPSAGEISATDYYLTDGAWASISNENDRRTYTWEKDYLFGTSDDDWLYPYRIVYRANTVLDHIDKLKKTASNEKDWNNIKGQAMFLRGKTFLAITNIWTKAYDESTAETDLGIPLRLNSDFNATSVRSSLKETYDQIISDFEKAAELLPEAVVSPVRPSKQAAYSVLARAYLFMRDYTACLKFTQQSLSLNNKLMDYNFIDPNVTFPLGPAGPFNQEVLHVTYLSSPPILNMTNAKVDSTLYQSYTNQDLRKKLLFRNNNDGSFSFRGSYIGQSTLFSGISVNELYLMKAECNARLGNLEEAMATLNSLLQTRFDKNIPFAPYEAMDKTEALKLILEERRKELIMRGLRWPDIKRLNKEGANIILKRELNGQEFILLPNDLRYALPIPEIIIERTGMEQNPR